MNRVLVFGASGYVGTHLVPSLAARGLTVRAAARRRSVLEARGWPDVELVQPDALAPDTLGPALDGVDVAYYLVHSMAAGRDFPRLDRKAAENFRDAAERAGVARIRHIKRGGKIWIRIFPHKSFTKKPAETRMGKGKGAPEGWIATVRPGTVMYEMEGVTLDVAKEAFRLAANKLPIPTKFLTRDIFDEE